MIRSKRPPLWRALASVLTGALIASAAIVGVAAPAQAVVGPSVSAPLAPRAGGTVTVTGQGFSTAAFGIYLGLRADGASEDVEGTTVWIDDTNLDEDTPQGKTAQMSAEGSFAVSVAIPAFVAGTSYSLVTRKAHGVVDATQSTTTAVAYEAVPAVGTSTSLVSDVNPSAAGAAVSFTATVSASSAAETALAGSVVFMDGAAALGTIALADGSATLTTSALTVGTHSVTAEFVPADAAYSVSTSAALTQVVTAVPAPDADSTATTLAVAPAARSVLGGAIVLTASVSNTEGTDAPLGDVEFFSTLAGNATPASLGVAAVDANGTAALNTTALSAGGHVFVAVYKPATSAFEGSQSAATANYGIVDAIAPTACTPGSTSTTTTDATASWRVSQYSYAGYMPWVRTADGENITVAGTDFIFANGSAQASAECAVVSFDGWFQVTPHDGVWVRFSDPVLSMDGSGAGVWTADITTSTNSTSQRIVFATFAGADAAPGETVDTAIDLDYEGATALGTWSAAFASAWPNEFVLAVPASIQAYFYQTSATGQNLTKPPAPFAISFDWPAVSATTIAVGPATRATHGDEVTLTATVSPSSAQGSVEFFDVPVGAASPVSLGSVIVTGGVAVFATKTLTAGGHTFRAEYTSTNGFDASSAATTANYGVVDTSVVAPVAPTEGAHVSGISASWDWSEYATQWTKVAGGNVSVDGSSFVLSGGTGIVGADGSIVVDFTGSLRAEAYASFFPPNGQWIELVDPTLVIDADGTGTWSADVRSGIGAYSASVTERMVVATLTDAVVPDFSGDSVDASFAFDYADSTAAGTWAASGATAYTSAWANAFVLSAPSAIQSFYYASGARGDGTKPPAELVLTWTEPVPEATIINGSASVVQGGVLRAVATGFRDGASMTVSAHSDPVRIGTYVADARGTVEVSWTVPADFAVGAHSLVFDLGNGTSVSVPFTVTAATPAAAVEPPAEPSCVARAVSGATIQWSVKDSFRTYIQGPIAKGSYSINWGSGSGAYSTESDRGRVSYGGSASFTGHSGLLSVEISNPRVQVNSNGSATLIVNVRSTNPDGSPAVNANGVAFANLSLPAANESGNRISWTGASATLTATGAKAFAGFYEAGAALDPVSFSFPLGAEVECDSTTTGSLAATGGDAGLDELWLAIGMLVLGAGIFAIRRRTVRA